MEHIIAMVIRNMITYFEGDIKRINHALKVYGLAKTIAQIEQMSPEEIFILEIAAALHDIGIKEAEKQYHSSAGNYQELFGPPAARQLLTEFELNNAILDRVCYLIGNHHSYNKIAGLDFQILVEADFLVNIDEDHLSRAQIDNIRQKYFRTSTGMGLLKVMFQEKQYDF
jgi:HD superfamily phosphodiesterase